MAMWSKGHMTFRMGILHLCHHAAKFGGYKSCESGNNLFSIWHSILRWSRDQMVMWPFLFAM